MSAASLHCILHALHAKAVENRWLKRRVAAIMMMYMLKGWSIAFHITIAQRNHSPRRKLLGRSPIEVWNAGRKNTTAVTFSGVGPSALEDAMLESVAKKQKLTKDKAVQRSMLVAEVYLDGQAVLAKEKPGTKASRANGPTKKLATLMTWRHNAVVAAVSDDKQRIKVKWISTKPFDCTGKQFQQHIHFKP